MVRFLVLFSFLAIMFSVPVMAQEDGLRQVIDPDDDIALEAAEMMAADERAAVENVEDIIEEKAPIKDIAETDNYDERLNLSRKMHEIWPVRPKVENALDIVAETIPQQERLRFKAALRKAIQFEALEQASVEAMADIFTAKELQAMIAFYGSKEGRSVSFKTSDYEQALQPSLVKMIDKALLDVKLGSQ